MPPTTKPGVLWIDINELFGQFNLVNHPIGISRVILGLADALIRERGESFAEVRLLLWDPVWRRPLWAGPEAFGSTLSAFFPALKRHYENSVWQAQSLRSGLRKGMISSLPRPLRFAMFPRLNGVTLFLGWARRAGLQLKPAQFSPGDCLFAPGSFWLGGYAPQMAAMARSGGAIVAAFVHDVMLLSHPRWTAPYHSEQFRRGIEGFLPLCSAVVCNSENTLQELRAHAGWAVRGATSVCRLADVPDTGIAAATVSEREDIHDLVKRTYALFVSTLIPRKNHRLLLLAWQRLWSRFGERTPWLLLAGDGAPDAATAQLLAQPQSFGHRVMRLTGVSDGDLEVLYRHAWLTVYPSLGEGYGLPVAEALARGKVCLATTCGGLAEIAPDLVDVIDAHDPEMLAGKLASYIDRPESLTQREDAIRAKYRATRWSDTARCVRGMLERTVATVAPR
ncbi:glycosyltransferase [Rhodoplanes sp. Z2-YC6860]|uniref:glycosyltransferase n=1 Tax=Rhodoplanes sp. Z2-YC6860 TaxID=674703 RepID=UPI00078D6A4E|nr:glycosyltransferase [Rhodoplanes sp. Z2-YC6860]AMN40075.1 glycosyl transferase [Rhodoplanes sp. Z2-YC6860]